MKRLRIALAQINPVVGDLQGNTRRILESIEIARGRQADILAFPELTITGYPPEDLLFRSQFIADNLSCLERIRQAANGPMAVILGFVERREDLYNAAAVIQDERIVGVYRKHLLPNYGVFDENRYFQSSTENCVFTLGDIPFGVSICEDIWVPAGPARNQALHGNALLLINISASPYHRGKPKQRWNMLATRARDNTAMVAMVNLVGGQDELIFDGASGIFDPSGEPLALGKLFEEDFLLADLALEAVFHERLRDPRRRGERAALASRGGLDQFALPLPPANTLPSVPCDRPKIDLPCQEEEIYRALVLGTRDYVDKNGFEKAVLGLSGGVDSALTASIAVDALGTERVVFVGMPSQFSSDGTQEDTRRMADNLGCELIWISIQPIYEIYLQTLKQVLGPHSIGVTEENIQSRIRGNLLMALSNYHGWLVLTTGNKSEASVGYCTLYGDMAGGVSVIKDLSKALVYQLCRYRNKQAGRPWIPESILQRVPSAELKPNQKDSDSLPEYDVLDRILQAYVEEEQSFSEILALGLDLATVRDVIGKVDCNEYKRRQSPPGLKITPRALGKDRRLPITNRYRIFNGLDSPSKQP